MVLIFSFALLLIFGCSDYERDNIYDQNGKHYTGGVIGGSSSSGSSSSSAGDSSGGSSSSFGSSSSSAGDNGGGSSSSFGSSSSSAGDSSSSAFVGTSGTFIDERDSQTYNWVRISDQIWMAENLNYNASGSKCGDGSSLSDENTTNCDIYGRLYNWATAMDLDPDCRTDNGCYVQSKRQGICPKDWHIPSNEDWDKLYRYADGTSGTSSPYDSPTAGKHLKAKTGWSSCGPSGLGLGSPYSCEDTYGFSALPGGRGGSDGDFSTVDIYGLWWSASEFDSDSAYFRYMGYDGESAFWYYNGKAGLFSVRCLQD